METIALMPHLWIVPLVAVFFAALGCLWWFGFARWWPSRERLEYPEDRRLTWCGWSLMAVIWWACSAATVITWAFLLMPYDAKYHHFYKLEGTITSITNTFDSGSGDITQTPIIRLDSYPDPIASQTSRVMGMEGKDVVLTCTVEWKPYSMDTTWCDLAEVKP